MAKVYQKRASAAVKKQRKEALKREKTQAFLEKYKKHLIISAAALVVLIVIAVIVGNIIANIGTIPVKSGALEGAEENWIVADLGNGSSHKYYKLAEASAPEGYQAMAAEVLSADSLEQGPGYAPQDAASPITSIYYLPMARSTSADMSVLFSTLFGTPVETLTFGEYTVQMVPTTLQNTAGSTETDADGYLLPTGYSSAMYAFVDCSRDSSIMVQVLGDEVAAEEEVTSREDMLAALEAAMSCLTLETEE